MTTGRRVMWGGFIVAVLLVFTIWAGSRLNLGYRTPLTCCLRGAGTGGGLAVARWAEALGHEVRELRDPLWEVVDQLERPTGNCIITAGNDEWSPWGREMTEADWERVWTWIGRGNTLIVITAVPDLLPQPLLDVFGKERREETFFIDLPNVLESDPETNSARTSGGDSLVVRSEGPRWQDLSSEWRMATDAGGSVLHRVSTGNGSLYVLLDDYAWTNYGFDKGDNARVLARILQGEVEQPSSGGVLAFDEYRHGHGRVESFITFAWTLPGARTFFWIALLLAVLYLYARNRRFGPPEPFEQAERRTALEYVNSVAYLHQRARAAPLAVHAVVQRIRSLAVQPGRDDAEFERSIAQAERAGASMDRPPRPARACRLVSELIRLRKRQYGS